MPSYQQYLKQDYVYGELGRILGGIDLGLIRGNPNIMMIPFKLGFYDGFGLQKTEGVKVNVRTSDDDLADKLKGWSKKCLFLAKKQEKIRLKLLRIAVK